MTHSDGKDLKKVNALASAESAAPIEVMSVAERGRADTHVLMRGNPLLPADKVEPGVPQILGGLSFAGTETRSRRRALAEWLTDSRNPRTPRVAANRVWQYHFGRGIVPTPNEFGGLGEAATHPDLLDWLASELIDGQWRLKRMHRMIVLSSATACRPAERRLSCLATHPTAGSGGFPCAGSQQKKCATPSSGPRAHST